MNSFKRKEPAQLYSIGKCCMIILYQYFLANYYVSPLNADLIYSTQNVKYNIEALDQFKLRNAIAVLSRVLLLLDGGRKIMVNEFLPVFASFHRNKIEETQEREKQRVDFYKHLHIHKNYIFFYSFILSGNHVTNFSYILRSDSSTLVYCFSRLMALNLTTTFLR